MRLIEITETQKISKEYNRPQLLKYEYAKIHNRSIHGITNHLQSCKKLLKLHPRILRMWSQVAISFLGPKENDSFVTGAYPEAKD